MKSIAFSALALLVAASTLRAQTWTVTYLHPTGATYSQVYAVDGTQQLGQSNVSIDHAAIWTGSADSFTDFNPSSADYSGLRAIAGTQIVGFAAIAGNEHAGIWSSTPDSFLDLNPGAVATGSFLSATNGTQQAGFAIVGGSDHAGLWTGTAHSFVDLNPAGATTSFATGVSSNGLLQVGYAMIGGNNQAMIWTGTAASVVNLNPAGASESEINGISGAQEVGHATIAGLQHAGTWANTTSFTNLNPVTAFSSDLLATIGTRQAGWANFTGAQHAGIWAGTSDSFIDLHFYLSSNYLYSQATSLWSDGTTTLVGGFAYNGTTHEPEAVLWRLNPAAPVPAAPTLAISGKKSIHTSKAKYVVKGTTRGTVTSITAQVGKKAVTASGTTAWKFTAKLTPGKNKIEVIAHGPGGNSAPVKLTITRG